MDNLHTRPAPLLALRHVSVDIQTDDHDKHALQDISFEVKHGEILALVGESGSGKSICAQSIMGLLPKPAARITAGHIIFDGQDITHDPAVLQTLRGKRMAMIFQEPMSALNPVQNIATQLGEVFSLHFPSMTEESIRHASLELLTQVGVSEPEQRLTSFPHQLSGGLCQRVMIAMALAGKPDLLIADEPSTALDVSTQQQLLLLLQKLQKQMGLTIIFITHDLALVAQWCQRVAVLQHGRLCELDTTANIFTAPQHPYTRQLLAATCDTPIVENTDINLTVLLSVHHLYKQFSTPKPFLALAKPPRQVLKDISLDIHDGEIVALVGESGCGKSTLGRAILFLDPPNKGEIYFQGQLLNSLSRESLRQVRSQLQVIFQDTNDSLDPRQTISKILAEPLEIHGDISGANREVRIRELLDIVELPADSLNRFPHEFSGGQRQRIGIARAIALNPKLIICDEAVSALDVSTQNQIIQLLLKLKSQMNLALLFITHDLKVVKRIADRVFVMHEGCIVEHGNTLQIFDHPSHHATQTLVNASPKIPAFKQA